MQLIKEAPSLIFSLLMHVVKVNPTGLTGVNSLMGVVAWATLRRHSGKRTMCGILQKQVVMTDERQLFVTLQAHTISFWVTSM